ncbi:putative DNA polymerase epsilon catalytic subunit A [Blattamonas nauphoetae]|uniref:DNA polymerase epsilon catalytic subunit n=1 Tax=Blattamonas nauphoetae TaxID=2049346 RepID=A0ABQ9XE49_9EUKA|nr:putative DNA polymerase epsilon catalytic subunit A [Blattamonas nauphoetae]
MLIHLRDNPEFITTPLIYHLDIAAMYPNIILTNRLQPVAIVSQNKECVRCTFNSEENRCQRKLPWCWRGEVYECEKNQQDIIKAQLIAELGDNSNKTEEEKALIKTTGHRTKKTRERREDIVCQRENNFYIRMVRDFRDRRYEYKRLLKDAQQAYRKAVADKANEVTLKEKTVMVVLYDSLQLAHKRILNTFSGYVILLDKLGSPLEIDTDGIWSCLPSTFPNTFQIKTKSGKKAEIPFLAVMLNADVTANFSNDQYQDIDSETGGFANVGLSSLNRQSGIFQSMWKILQIAPSTPPIPALRIQNVSSATVSSHIPSIFSPLSTNELTMWMYCWNCHSNPNQASKINHRGHSCSVPVLRPIHQSINHSNSSSLRQEYNTPHKFITSVRRVEAVLPHNVQPHYLFQCTIDPSLDTSGWMMAITRDRNVAKVFESEVSPTFRAITSLGSCCRLKKFTAKTSLDNVFDVSEF